MSDNSRPSIWRYAGLGFILGVLAAGINLFLGLFLNTYIAFDIMGSVVLSYSAATTVAAEYSRLGRKPKLHDFLIPAVALVVPFVVPQVPVIWLSLRYWYRSLLFDLAAIGLIIWGVWLYTTVENWEERWRRAATRGAPAPENVLRYPIAYLLIGLLAGGFFLALLVISNTIGKNETTTWWTSALFGGMALLGLVIVVAYFRERHFVDEEGVSYRPPLGLGARRFLAWNEVRAVEYSPLAQWFVLKSFDGAKARIPFYVTNADRFAHLLLTHVPQEVISARAMRMLEMLRGEEDNEP